MQSVHCTSASEVCRAQYNQFGYDAEYLSNVSYRVGGPRRSATMYMEIEQTIGEQDLCQGFIGFRCPKSK